MTELTPVQRRALRAQAHHLNPVVSVAGNGLSPSVLAEIERNLDAHELIKVRVYGEDRDARDAIMAEVCERTGAANVQHIGNILVLWRKAPEPVEYRGYEIRAESVAPMMDEFRALQRMYWDEVGDEGRGSEFVFSPELFIRREVVGQYLVITIRHAGELVGFLSIYVTSSTRSRLRIAVEDAMFVRPEHRKGFLVPVMMRYADRACWATGADELRASAILGVVSNKQLPRMGFRHVANLFVKLRPRELT